MKKNITLFVLNLIIFHVAFSQISLNDLDNERKTPSFSLQSKLPSRGFGITPLSIETENHKSLNDMLTPADTFNRHRFGLLMGAGGAAYLTSVALLNNVWYAQYPRSRFHYFDDEGEWMQMDKVGHIITAYQTSKWVYGAMRWTGMKNQNSAWFGMAVGMFFQTTLEALDGFSTEWGFSWSDMAANTTGCALFGLQQAAWNEQRMVIKVSNMPRVYPQMVLHSIDGSKTTTIQDRTNNLYGDNFTQTFFKDYNALTIWLSINPKSFSKDSRLPDWLNIAVGYGADNMYGARYNQWPAEKPEFVLSKTDYPRYRQLYLSLDLDLSRIKTKSKFLNTLFRTINFIKIPSPTLEFNTLGKVKFHPLFF